MRILGIGLAVAILLAAGNARAGRTRFGWLFDTDTLPERGVELESWVLEELGKGEDQLDEALLWWGPVVGITDQIEVALPVEVGWREVPFDSPETEIERFGGELRWRLTSPDPIEAGAFAPLVRVGFKRVIPQRGVYQAEADLVLSLDAGRVHLVGDLGAVVRISETARFELRPGLGASVRTWRELRLGAECYSEVGLTEESGRWYSLGPNLAWTHGRFWLAASVPVGLSGIDVAPRVNLAIAF